MWFITAENGKGGRDLSYRESNIKQIKAQAHYPKS